MEKSALEQTGWKIYGQHKIILCEIKNKLSKEIELLLARPGIAWNEYKELMKELKRIAGAREWVVENIIPTAGRSVIARWIVGDNTYDADDGANYGSLGTNNAAPANGDTQLGTETYRKATSSATSANNISYLSNFYTAAEVTGTFEEAGWHIDATGAANSGQLLSHFLTGTIVKTNVETLTVESILTVN